jgi:hypothetical protein
MVESVTRETRGQMLRWVIAAVRRWWPGMIPFMAGEALRRAARIPLGATMDTCRVRPRYPPRDRADGFRNLSFCTESL